MSSAHVLGQAVIGLTAQTIEIEATISNGLPQLNIVGMSEHRAKAQPGTYPLRHRALRI